MLARSSSLVSLVAWLFALTSHAVAGTSVTFDILGNFAYPGGAFTEPHTINNNGDIAGHLNDQTSGATAGFVRYRNGAFSMPIIDPNDGASYTYVSDATDSSLCGFYRRSDLHFHGFILSGDTFTDVVVPRVSDTYLTGMDEGGSLCGYTYDPSTAFVSIDSVVTSFTVPGAVATYPSDINNLGECVGSYNTGSFHNHGFRRSGDGTLNYPVDVPGATSTFLNGINDQGVMVGEADTATGIHGLYFPSASGATLFDYPGASVTVFTGINRRGWICGFYQTATNMISRGFVVRVRPATD